MGHHHHHHHPTHYTRLFAIAVVLNFLYVLFQGGFALVANSMSLLADAGHNLGDVLGLALAWGAHYLLSQGGSDRFSYGHKKTTIMAALVNAILLIVTSLVIVQESIKHLMYAREVHEQLVVIIASIGIVINGGTAMLFMEDRDTDLNIKAAFWHLAADTMISLGVVVTAIVISLTGWEWLDPVVGLLIVITILFTTWGLLRDTLNLLLDAVPSGVDQVAVRDYLMGLDRVVGVHDLHIWGLSTHEVALTAHLEMREGYLDDNQLQAINDHLLREYKIEHVTVQVEHGQLQDPCSQKHSCI